MSNTNTKKSLFHQLKSASFSFVKNFKNYIATSVAIVLLAAIVIAFFGFNTSFEMQKGHTFNVSFGTEITESQEKDVINVITSTLNNQNIKKFEIQKNGENETNIIVVSIHGRHNVLLDSDSWENISESIENSISSQHTFGALNISNVQTTSPVFGFSQIITPLLAILIITVVYAILSLIRFDFQTLLSLIIGAFHDIALFMALVVILRVQVSPLITTMAVVVYMYSLIINSITFSAIKTGFINQSFEKQTNASILQNVLKSGFGVKLILTSLLVLAGLLLTATGLNPALATGISLIITAIVVGYSSHVITPSIWALTYNKVNDKRLAKRIEIKQNPNKDDEEMLVV